jgi:predicted metallopeptidase
MGRKSNVYSRVPEAEEIIKQLCEKYPAVLWAVRSENVAVLGIENKERSEKNNTLAKIKAVKGTEKAIYISNNIPIRYIIELYWSDINAWSAELKQAIIFHELLHCHPEFERTVKHDLEDFRLMIGSKDFGVDWSQRKDLPNLLTDDVKFDLNLLPKIEDLESEEDNLDDEEKKMKIKEAKEKSKEEKKNKKKLDKASEAGGEDINEEDDVLETKDEVE